MKISRQTLYLLIASLFLLVVVLLFSFLVLIPSGKEYRILRVEMKKERLNFQEYEHYYEKTYKELKELQSNNRRIIMAFNSSFDSKRFLHQHKESFEALHLSKLTKKADDEGFEIYEVNATSKIDTPQIFYDFIDDIAKSDWIVGVNFPIRFVREGSLIHSNFTMRVYSDSNSSQSVENAVASSKR